MKVEVELDAKKTAKRLCNDRDIGMFIAETCRRYFDPYVPFDTGMLSTNVTCEPFCITYNVPYAHRIYMGDDFNFSKEKHPLASAEWDKPAIRAKGNAIAEEIARYMEK